MEMKTKVTAHDGKQELIITREFDLPVELLFKAHVDPDLIVQWKTPPGCTANLQRYEGVRHGSFQMQSIDAAGKVVGTTCGVIHELITNSKIIRTFEVINAPMGVTLEVYDFEKLTDQTSRLRLHVIYQTVVQRDMALNMPFAYNLNMAHNRMEEIVSKLK